MNIQQITKHADEVYMRRALQLAKLGGREVAPNPMVGAVIVLDDKIIGEGYHQRYGQPHAEVNAVNAVANKARLRDATIYVTLEPCAHFGKTPPCSNLLIHHAFQRVVVACVDTFSEVSGKGIERMRNAGIKVEVGVLEQEARALNKRFFTFHEKKRPFITLKWAKTADGFLDRSAAERLEGINWITGPLTKQYVHSLRAMSQGILVGWKTIEQDDPELTVREIAGKNPVRLILDPHGRTQAQRKVYSDGLPTWVFVKEGFHPVLPAHVRVISLTDFSLEAILGFLHQEQIASVFVEGGAYTLQQFLDKSLWDEAYVFTGGLNFNDGTPAPQMKQPPISTSAVGADQLNFYSNL